MNKSIRVKNSFTLIELIIVILLISAITFLTASNFSFFNTQKEYKVSIENVKNFMLENFEFKNELLLTCVEDQSLNCYILVDGVENKDNIIKNLFTRLPEVYNYDKNLTDYEFTEIRLNNESFTPFFELKIDNDGKHKNIVLDTIGDKVYLFSSISRKTTVFESTNDITDNFFELETEVKDAF